MKISEVIKKLQAAMEKHGDLPTYTYDSDIARVEVAACRDGISVMNNGKPINEPNELVITFHPGR
jgi:hypothetical protein